MTGRGQRFLTLYACVLTAVFAATLATGFASKKGMPTFDEITVRRINVIESDGTLRMVISDHARFPGIIVHGKEQPFDRPQAGMLFYNDEGSENGGLIFGGHKNAKGEVVDSGGSLSFDRYGGNQEAQLIGVHDKDDRLAGLIVSDSPPGAQSQRRIWVGRGDDGAAAVALMDAQGRKRILMQVLADGTPSLVFLDANGKVVNQMLPSELR